MLTPGFFQIKLLRHVSKEIRQEFVTKLNESAGGMFLWVDLMLKEIATKHKIEQIRQAMLKPPRKLSDMMHHILERLGSTLPDDEKADLNEMLAWAVCARRELTLDEFDSIMKLKSTDGNGIIYLEGTLLRLLAYESAHFADLL